jgi:hypothetical protein
MIEPACESHCRVVNGSHLRRKHGLYLIAWLYALHHGKHEVESVFVYRAAR